GSMTVAGDVGDAVRDRGAHAAVGRLGREGARERLGAVAEEVAAASVAVAATVAGPLAREERLRLGCLMALAPFFLWEAFLLAGLRAVDRRDAVLVAPDLRARNAWAWVIVRVAVRAVGRGARVRGARGAAGVLLALARAPCGELPFRDALRRSVVTFPAVTIGRGAGPARGGAGAVARAALHGIPAGAGVRGAAERSWSA